MAKKRKKKEEYETYEGFLRAAIKAYWESGTGSKVNFLALLLASREAWQVAWEGISAPGSGKKILTGAAGAAAVALLLRTVVGGPIGILLTGATIASLVAVYVKNHRKIWARVEHYKGTVDKYRELFEEVKTDYVDGSLRADQRDLMMDGLLGRFLTELDEFEWEDPDEYEDDEDDEDVDERSAFERHADRKRAEEEEKKAARAATEGREGGGDDEDDEDDEDA